jgi:signal transduction histidine kinase
MRGDPILLTVLSLGLLQAAPLQAAIGTRASIPASLDTSLELSQASRAVLATDPARAATLAEAAGRFADQSAGDPRRRAIAIATARWLQGETSLRLNNPIAAKTLLADAFGIAIKQAPGSELQADILISRARLESTTDQVQAALADYLAAFEIYKAAANRHQQAVALQDIGLLYHDAGDYTRSLSYYQESRTVFSGVPLLDLSVDNNRADSLEALGRFAEAEAEYLNALKIAGSLNSPSLEAQILSNLAVAQISDHQYSAARATVEKGLRLARGSAANASLPTLLSTQAQLNLREGNLAAAQASIDAIRDQPTENNASERDEWVHRTKYEVYRAEGRNREALMELEAYQKIQNGHRTLMDSVNSALLAARFDFDNQNARIAALKTGELRRDIALTRLKVRQGQIVLGGLLVMFTALIIFLMLYLRSLRVSNRRSREINAQLGDTNARLEDALQAKTQFLATTSHEIRTPLNGVLGMTEVLLAGGQLSTWVRERVALIHGAGEAMRNLVDDLLDMSTMDAARIVLQREPLNLPALLSESYKFWTGRADGAGLTLSLDTADCPIMIVEDARRLRQILSNLLSNAVKFTPAGSITLSSRCETAADGELLLISVSDTGIGIAESAREMIFDTFTQIDTSTTRRFAGTGLGLSIARNLARTMGGDIEVDANAAGGSTFMVTLPLVRAAAETSSPPEVKAAAQTLADLSIMVVEANPITQGGLRSLLERRVGLLSFKSTITEAIDDVDAADLVVISFPRNGAPQNDATRLDTIELARTCQRIGVRLVIIIDPADQDAVAGLRCAGASFLERPVTAKKLSEHVERLHDLHSPQAMALP